MQQWLLSILPNGFPLNMSTQKQIEYCNYLLGRHDDEGTLDDVIHGINPNYGEDEDFSDWFKRLPVAKASEVISTLKEAI